MVETLGTCDSPSLRVMFAVADAKDIDPTDLRPLTDIVDPDVLDALVRTGPGAGELENHPVKVRFSYEGCEVVVHGNGDLTVGAPGDGH